MEEEVEVETFEEEASDSTEATPAVENEEELPPITAVGSPGGVVARRSASTNPLTSPPAKACLTLSASSPSLSFIVASKLEHAPFFLGFLAFFDLLRAPHFPVLFPLLLLLLLLLLLPLAKPIVTRSRGRSAKRASAAASAGAYLGEPSLPSSSSSTSVSESVSSEVEFFALGLFFPAPPPPACGGSGRGGGSGASTSNSSLTSDELDVPLAPDSAEAGAMSPAGTPSSAPSSGSVEEGEGEGEKGEEGEGAGVGAALLPLSASGSGSGVSERSSLLLVDGWAWTTPLLAARIAKSRTQRSSAAALRPEGFFW